MDEISGNGWNILNKRKITIKEQYKDARIRRAKIKEVFE